MLRLPSLLADDYRPATEREIHTWSFGLVRSPRRPGASTWEARRGTLDDQAIFGPVRDGECACGKYRGANYRGMICDICGVKVTTPAARRERFGHIDLPSPVPHPLGSGSERLSVLPVLPAAFVESPAGRPAGELYEELLGSRGARSHDEVTRVLERLFALLLPAAVLASEWELADRGVFTRGLALEQHGEPAEC